MINDINYDDYAQKLTNEYKSAYEKMAIYIEAILFPGDNLSVIMNEVVDLLLSAQEDSRPLEDVIGSDMKLFCNQLVKSHTNTPLHRIFQFLNAYRILSLIAFILTTIGLIVDFFDGVYSPWTTHVEMGAFFCSMFISLFIFILFKLLTRKLIFKYSWYTKKVDNIITVILFFIIFISIFFIPEQIDSLIPLPRWLFLFLTLSIYTICTLHKNQQKRIDQQEENYFSFDDSVMNENIMQMRKKYNKYCVKQKKKNLIPLDVQTWYEERFQKDKRMDYYGSICFIIMVLIIIIGTFITSETPDAMLFTSLLLIIEIPIYKLLDKGKIARLKLYQMIHEKQIDIFDQSLNQ